MEPGERTLQTRSTLVDDLGRLGVSTGDTVLVHSSLRALGYVLGGATTVVHALLDAVGAAGTVVVPAQTPENRDPSRWTDPAVPPPWWARIRAELPPFDPDLTPSAGVGAVAERVRTWPGSVRSHHPQTSFAALGPRAAGLMAGHALTSPLGEESPLARLEAVDARVLLLGVDYARCTAFHLAEYRLPQPPSRENGCAVMTTGGRRWITYRSVALDAGPFAALGADFEDGRAVRTGRVGDASSRYLRLRDAVTFAYEWMMARRSGAYHDACRRDK
jgi:aminoglycoside 3-N-acetyltransferase